MTKLEHFKENLSNFSKKISQIQNINLWNVFGASMITCGIKLNNFGSILLWNDPFGSKCHIPMLQSPVCPPPWRGVLKKQKFSKLVIEPKLLNMIYRTHKKRAKSKKWALYLKNWASYGNFHGSRWDKISLSQIFQISISRWVFEIGV